MSQSFYSNFVFNILKETSRLAVVNFFCMPYCIVFILNWFLCEVKKAKRSDGVTRTCRLCWNTETELLLPLQLHTLTVITEASQLHSLLTLTSRVEIFMIYQIKVCIILSKIIRMEGFQCALNMNWCGINSLWMLFFHWFKKKQQYFTIVFLAHSVQFSRY